MTENPSRIERLIKTFQLNSQQLSFGSYAAELSFYIIWAIVPLMLAIANTIAVLPFSSDQIITTISQVIPDQVQSLLIPLLEDYLNSTSTGVFSLGLIISLWPASNVFNTIQRVFNTIYKTQPRQNMFVARAFAYIFTVALVISGIGLGFVVVFGETIFNFIQETFMIDLGILHFIVRQSGAIGFILVAGLLLIMYHFIPNVTWPLKYSIPGTVVSLIGFSLISQLFSLVVGLMGKSTSNQTIGVFIILIIWLYFNAMVVTVGAFINVFYYDFKERNYWHVMDQVKERKTFANGSSGFVHYSQSLPALKNRIYLDNNPGELKETKYL